MSRRLLLVTALVTTMASVTHCDLGKYESRGLSCQLCPAGQYVKKYCDRTHPTECSECETGTFTAHPNSETSCLLCTQCRDDQEVVTPCSLTSNQQCRCKSGTHYCNSVHCMEMCYRCTRCTGDTIHACNATHDAVCAAEENPVPGNPNKDNGLHTLLWLFVPGILITLMVCACCSKSQCVQLLQRVLRYENQAPSMPAKQSCGSSLLNKMSLPMVSKTLPEALSVNWSLLDKGSALAPGATNPPEPSEDPEDGMELQVLGGSDTAPEQESQACAPAACDHQGPAEASDSLRRLQQEYEHKYYLKESSCNATNRIYYEFGHQVAESHWKMFMRFVGLEDSDIEICEYENHGNLMEQHHKMLLKWRNKHGKEASVFKLMAALHEMKLHVPLQNIINKLVAENIFGRYAETQN